MKNKKTLWLCVAAAVLVAAAIGGYFAYQNHVYHETYILIDGGEYRRDARQLDLSGKPLVELEKLAELPGLQQLNLLDTGITEAQYEAIQASLPECSITWSVPFQGGHVSSALEELAVEELKAEDVAQLQYLPALTAVDASGSRDYEVLMALEADRPDLTVTYTVPFGKAEFDNHAAEITVASTDPADLAQKLPLLPRVETVHLEGTDLSAQQLLELTGAFPELDFTYQLIFQGITVGSDTEFIDLSGIQLGTTEELESLLPLLPKLTKVDMIKCGFSNQEMAALNERHRDVNFVWKVYVSGVGLRTDATNFMPVKYELTDLGDCSNLKYCTEMRVLDFGHYVITNLDFIEYMPKLEYLLLHSCPITDVSVIGNCTSLRFLELMNTKVTDFWPLTNLTNLEDLNLCWTNHIEGWKYGPFGDFTPLLQMTWLDRLWIVNSNVGPENRELINEALPGTIVHYFSASEGSVKEGWRHSLNYYKHRDILEVDKYGFTKYMI